MYDVIIEDSLAALINKVNKLLDNDNNWILQGGICVSEGDTFYRCYQAIYNPVLRKGR